MPQIALQLLVFGAIFHFEYLCFELLLCVLP